MSQWPSCKNLLLFSTEAKILNSLLTLAWFQIWSWPVNLECRPKHLKNFFLRMQMSLIVSGKTEFKNSGEAKTLTLTSASGNVRVVNTSEFYVHTLIQLFSYQ